ncbi:MAG TPA: sigma-54 dependent transcriptional regulator, partial [Myxococcota bacterium]|nr:sigma-54 dependent transcriptional regulator [Myxococcota bacterium]
MNAESITEHDLQALGPMLLETWREAGRHLEIGEAVERVAPLVARRLPVDALLVRWFDVARGCVETLAASDCGSSAAVPRSTRSEVDAEELEALLAFARDGRVLHRRAAALSDRLPGALPAELEGDVLLAPLADEHGPIGLLVLASRRARGFAADHPAVVRALLEPFGYALAHDRRLREAEAQREAAEADRRTLLSRLGRSDLQETIVGGDAGFREVMERVGLAAPSDVPVLVLGETGSGKEVVARAIHARSRRASGPFLRVNCGAIPSGLIDSELFGHERGSFTGAAAQRKGWFERADGGTLFLDEVGELPPAAQVRLLRILQDGTFERVGGQKVLHVDVRIVAATHRDLRAMVAEGTFREDLWYRLAVLPIEVPPLRERPEDIPALANHFALRAATRFGAAPRIPAPEDLDLLVAYPWPGNVRELGAVIERAVILGNGERLDVATALGVAPAGTPRPSPAASASSSAAAARASVPDGRGDAATAGDGRFPTLDEAMGLHIEAALARTRGRIEGPRGAAALLDINPHT